MNKYQVTSKQTYISRKFPLCCSVEFKMLVICLSLVISKDINAYSSGSGFASHCTMWKITW